MTAQQNGVPATRGGRPVPNTPAPDAAALELALAQRRARLAATIDELVERSKPKEILRRTVQGLLAKAKSTVCTPEGEVRVERVAAVAVSATVVLAVLITARRRKP